MLLSKVRKELPWADGKAVKVDSKGNVIKNYLDEIIITQEICSNLPFAQCYNRRKWIFK